MFRWSRRYRALFCCSRLTCRCQKRRWSRLQNHLVAVTQAAFYTSTCHTNHLQRYPRLNIPLCLSPPFPSNPVKAFGGGYTSIPRGVRSGGRVENALWNIWSTGSASMAVNVLFLLNRLKVEANSFFPNTWWFHKYFGWVLTPNTR